MQCMAVGHIWGNKEGSSNPDIHSDQASFKFFLLAPSSSSDVRRSANQSKLKFWLLRSAYTSTL